MIISIKSINLPEETIKDFATFIGWKEFVMTTTESPNYEIDNPQTYTQFIEEKYGTPIWKDISNWNLQTAEMEAKALQDQANTILEEAKLLTDARAKEVVTVIVE